MKEIFDFVAYRQKYCGVGILDKGWLHSHYATVKYKGVCRKLKKFYIENINFRVKT